MPRLLGFEIKESDIGNFFLRILTEVDFNDPESVVQNLSGELATYFALSMESEEEYTANPSEKAIYDDLIGVHFFSVMKSSLKFRAGLKENFFVQLLQLSDIYKIFERC